MEPERPRSYLWFLLPVLLGLIGGIIAYFVLRHDDPVKAKYCLYIGIVLGVLGIMMGLLSATQINDAIQRPNIVNT